MSISRCLNKGDEKLVRVCHVIDPQNFYVRLADDDDWIVTFQGLVEDHTPLKFPRTSQPKFGQLVLLYHPKHNWARGVISKENDDGSFDVKTLDYGDIINLQFDELHRLDFGDATAPKAINCSLNMCFPKNGNVWSPSSIETFLKYLNEKPILMTVMDKTPKNQLIVELNSGWPETVSKLMIMAEAACFGNSLEKVDQASSSVTSTAPCFIYDSLKIGEEIDVQVLKVQGSRFHAVKTHRSDMYLSIYDLLEVEFEGCQLFKNGEIARGVPVVCKLTRRSLDHYFRGEVAKIISEKTVKVFLVDIGDYEVVKINDDTLRKCSLSLLEKPTFAIPCVLNETQKQNKVICNFLTPGLSLCVKTEKEQNHQYIVKITDDYLPKDRQ